MKKIIQITTLAITMVIANAATAQKNENRPPRPPPEEIIAEMIVNHDADENNSLNQAELSKALEGMRKLHKKHRAETRKHRDQSKNEQHAKHKHKIDPEKLLARFDKNEDSELDTGELLSMLHHMHKRRMHSKQPPSR